MSSDHEIAVLPGDGIGPEVIDASLPVLDSAADAYGISLETTFYDWGSQRYLETGEMMPEDGLDTLSSFDALLLGAVGHLEIPDHVTLTGLLLPLRKGFDQRICKRPATGVAGVESPLAAHATSDIDFVVYRENTEGEYADIGGRERHGPTDEIAIQSSVITRSGTREIVHAAFEAARDRGGSVTSITKSNAQRHTMVLWDEVVEEVSGQFPAVDHDSMLVDAAAMELIRDPTSFDVVVASNLFGDILTDIGAVISGGIGLAPSANICPSGEHPSLFEPVHGSAPDIAGENMANPLATVLSGAMLFDHLGETNAANALRDAVAEQLVDPEGKLTGDLGGEASTTAVTDDLIRRIS
jgi:tartrate dehydrogenase/decarboxylase/D-malate dehydrogenase